MAYCTIEANYWQTPSIARPLCDSRATCFFTVEETSETFLVAAEATDKRTNRQTDGYRRCVKPALWGNGLTVQTQKAVTGWLIINFPNFAMMLYCLAIDFKQKELTFSKSSYSWTTWESVTLFAFVLTFDSEIRKRVLGVRRVQKKQ